MTWRIVKLGDVCSINNGGTPKSKVREYWDGGVQWLTPKDMGKLSSRYVSMTGRQISQEGLDNSSAKIIPEESVILSCRAPIGHVAINQVPMSFNQGCKGLVPTDKILLEYLYYFLISSTQLLNDLGTGTTFKEISAKTLHQVDVPLPSIAVQQRIVAKLDAVFTEIDEAINKAEAKEAEVQKLKTSLLSSFFNGDDLMWKTVKLGEVCLVRRGTTITKKQTVEGDVPVIGGGTKPTYFHNEPNRAANCISVSGSGASAGFVNKWEVPIFASDCSTVEPKDGTQIHQFVYYYLMSQQKFIYDNFRSGAAQPHVYAKDIETLDYPIAPIAEQQRIVAKLDAANIEFRNANESIAKSKANYLALKSAILAQELQPSEAA